MEEFVYQRIKDVIENNGVSITKLSSELGLSQTTLNRQVTGVSALSSSVIEAILTYFPNLSAEWLLRGKGEMYLQTQDSKSDESADDAEELRKEILRLQGEIRALERLIQGEKKAVERKNVG